MTVPVAALAAAVQTNCHIADARHAADLSLCTYLLQMREFYRWEQGLPLGAPLARDAVGAWLAAREALWAELDGRDFLALPAGAQGETLAPFDVEALNLRLNPCGLAYGAGLAGPERPGFFLARLEQTRTHDEHLTVQVCGAELSRGLFAPPAALLGRTIVLRRESMARWLWEKFEAFGARRPEGAFKSVVEAYGLGDDFHTGLPRLLDEQGETLVLHELGEAQVARRLEPGWAAMRLALRDRRTELLVRAVRDQLADMELTLPTLLARGDTTAIHFWFAGYDGLRQQLHPALANAYAAWRDGDRGHALRAAVAVGARHFDRLAQQVLALHRQHGDAAGAAITTLLGAPQAVCRGW